MFDAVSGSAVAVCMTDMGDRFRLICGNIELVSLPYSMPYLPVTRLMWKLKLDFETGTKKWPAEGGGHHSVVSTVLDRTDIELYAKLINMEYVVIG